MILAPSERPTPAASLRALRVTSSTTMRTPARVRTAACALTWRPVAPFTCASKVKSRSSPVCIRCSSRLNKLPMECLIIKPELIG